MDRRTFVGDLQGSGRGWWPLLVAFFLMVVPACKHDVPRQENAASSGSAMAMSSASPEPAPSLVPSQAPSPTVAPSLCVELDAWSKALIEAGADIEGTLPRYRARNKAATGGTRELFRISGEFDRISRAKAESFRAKEAALKVHAVANGEAPIQADLLKGYSATATAYEKFAEAFHAGPAGFPELQGLDQAMRGTIESLAQKLDAALKKKCVDLASASASAAASAAGPTAASPSASSNAVQCLPCRTQEDFDGAAVKRMKCCETHACRTDDECPVGRVCCRIPGGELCANATRCTPPNRVEQ
jgi:hypothetical protein